jgi:hypothetical protein
MTQTYLLKVHEKTTNINRLKNRKSLCHKVLNDEIISPTCDLKTYTLTHSTPNAYAQPPSPPL